ncbi:FAD-dependent oxidoreductase [Jeotgalibacillus sp. ET6]|uniref:NAD(P)/FAD-dependent oxidoreductase n=1 Tax=Jeotgalibacillus sp. ET6 TaxID=3037260 RepID=UPI0024182867|nr:FAD-dependent oxidoreductase [Jeotgalibacillus sp. ET6]MDG5473653.1 FAD-dependent oxidoreductase [Jeotgalibacillus sp. ET6]
MRVVIIGAGLSGLFAAKTLDKLGHNTIMIEKGRSAGGRMATRRIGEGRADHGAQFFTVRSEELQKMTEDWLEKHWIKKWFGDDFPRYIGVEGMNPFIKKLSSSLSIELNERAVNISSGPIGVTVHTEKGEHYEGDAVILTAPVPQSLELLQKSPQLLNEENERLLKSISFKSCFTGLLSMKTPIQIGRSGIQSKDLPDGVDKIVANDQKGISAAPILSVYMSGDWSDSHFHLNDELVLEKLISTLPSSVTGQIDSSQLKRWRYSEANDVFRYPYMRLGPQPVYLAGDSFLTENDSSGRTRIESAILSGIRAGEAVASDLSNNI